MRKAVRDFDADGFWYFSRGTPIPRIAAMAKLNSGGGGPLSPPKAYPRRSANGLLCWDV